jgi:hypothetical protein
MEQNNTEQKTSLVVILAQLASIWILSDVGYYLFLPALGNGAGYNTTPLPITIYYIFWTLIAIFAFKDQLQEKKFIDSRWKSISLFLAGTFIMVLYLAYVMPFLKAITWTTSLVPPSELLYATSWYFLPKSIEIFLQQILLLTLVTAFTDEKYSLITTSAWCAGLFGGAHLLLVLGGGGFIYVSVFTIVAVVSSFIFPYLLLRVKNGIVYSYFLHWFFYAVVIVLTRLVFKV